MLNKDFYITYGKLLYALAKSDGYLQEIEKEKIIDLVHDKLATIETQNDFSGTDLAFYTSFAFEAAEEFELTVQDALLEFTAHFKFHHLHMSYEQRQVLITVMEDVARIYGKVTKKELSIIEKFKELVQ